MWPARFEVPSLSPGGWDHRFGALVDHPHHRQSNRCHPLTGRTLGLEATHLKLLMQRVMVPPNSQLGIIWWLAGKSTAHGWYRWGWPWALGQRAPVRPRGRGAGAGGAHAHRVSEGLSLQLRGRGAAEAGLDAAVVAGALEARQVLGGLEGGRWAGCEASLKLFVL